MAILIHVSVVSGKASKSLLNRRERLSQPKVRSTIQRHCSTRNPCVLRGRFTIERVRSKTVATQSTSFPALVIWLNPFWGPVSEDGKTFEQMKTYQDMKKRIETVISLPTFNDELFPQDIASMLKGRLTFKDAIASPALTLMSRQRLK